MKLNLTKFALLLAPALKAFVQWLHERHAGDVKAAAAELRQIQDHGAQLTNFRAEIDRRMAELESKHAAIEAKQAENEAAARELAGFASSRQG